MIIGFILRWTVDYKIVLILAYVIKMILVKVFFIFLEEAVLDVGYAGLLLKVLKSL